MQVAHYFHPETQSLTRSLLALGSISSQVLANYQRRAEENLSYQGMRSASIRKRGCYAAASLRLQTPTWRILLLRVLRQ
jgi:hypothetical protein